MSIQLKNKENSNPVIVNNGNLAIVYLNIEIYYYNSGEVICKEHRQFRSLVTYPGVEISIPYEKDYSSIIITYKHLDDIDKSFYAFNYDRPNKKVYSIGMDLGVIKSPISKERLYNKIKGL